MRTAGLRAAALAAALVVAVPAPGCAGRKARLERERAAEFVVAQDVYDRAQQEIGRRNLRKARLMLEKIQFSAEDRTRLEPLVRLALADSAFYLGDDLSLIEARAKYQDFVTLYADHPLAPYAAFQAGVCSAKQVRTPSRDQSQTLAAIGDLREVLRRYPDSRFAIAARDAIDQAQANLAEHEYLVGRFYLQKQRYAAAAGRFRHLLDAYPRYAAKDKLYFGLGKALYLSENPAESLAWFDRLYADYPEGKYAASARKFLADPPSAPKPKAAKRKGAPAPESGATTGERAASGSGS
jgi:outer membrane protein assembly factor BamD